MSRFGRVQIRLALRRSGFSLCFALVVALGACASGEVREIDPDSAAMEGFRAVEDLYVVDCLLPGEVRRMGQMTYLSPRIPVKTTARDCRIRGGEYVVYSRANYQSALNVWMGRASEGDAKAQVIVGEIYERGLGRAPDYAAAAKWYRKAAGQGNSRAQMHLAYMYEQGLGVEQDLMKAMNLYRNASGLDGDALILASAAKEKITRVRAQLEEELSRARAQSEALRGQIEKLKRQLEQHAAVAPAPPADQQKTIAALEALLAQTNARLKEKSTRLAQLKEVEVTSVSITRGPATSGPVEVQGLNLGEYYALVIGLEDYKYWDDLQSPREDAEVIAKLLAARFGFNTTLVLNADAYDILGALNDLRDKVRENDNVLIYFAGHGQLRTPVQHQAIGYWLPVNAQRNRTTFWLPNSQINEQIAMLDARGVLVMADSCYAGALSSDPASLLMGGDADLTQQLLQMGLQRRARFILSSGGLHPVLDQGSGAHSVFAAALIGILKSSNEVMRAQDLVNKLTDEVTRRAAKFGFDQRPELRPIRAAGHMPGGGFYLVPRSRQADGLDATPILGYQ